MPRWTSGPRPRPPPSGDSKACLPHPPSGPALRRPPWLSFTAPPPAPVPSTATRSCGFTFPWAASRASATRCCAARSRRTTGPGQRRGQRPTMRVAAPRAASPRVSAKASSMALKSPRAANAAASALAPPAPPNPAAATSIRSAAALNAARDASLTLSAAPIEPSASRTRSSIAAGESGLRLAREELTHLGISQPGQPHRHHARLDRRQQPAEVGRGQDEPGGRRLLEQLEERVRRIRTRLLRHQPLRVPDDEYRRATFHRLERRTPLDQPDRGERMARHPVERSVERVLPPLRDDLADQLRRFVYLLVRIRRPWAAGSARSSARRHARVHSPDDRPGMPTRLELAPLT